ncbi:hypothetical protein [Gimesia algae]|uniref:Peptidase MA-like domain-containing protein n=1 Tax=Gimesia algae TaxID=2527971 RepID=A0A517VAD6_9PLAN|nr:hypothetical protein [Gimesia algae]QDT89956.1 hypothetical protein Pan161_15890 [Gimesia algae]
MRHNRSHTHSRMIALTILLGAFTSTAITSAQQPQKTDLKEHYVYDDIRVFYVKEGPGAVSPVDIDKNGVSDQVENVAKQVWAAHQLFCHVLKFPDPFESERYKGVNCIQVSIRDRKEMSGLNGVAFSRAQRARKIPEGKPTDRAIVMSISSQLDPTKNVTPTHETFHLIQYGTTYFKNAWYLEGMARWSEHGTGKDGLGDVKYSPRGPWPQIPLHLQRLAKMKSESEHVLWNPIAAHTDRDGFLTGKMLGKKLSTLRYADGTLVLRDRFLQGGEVMRDILVELGKLDDVAFKDLKYETWTEDNARALENNPYIYKAIMDALRKHDSKVGQYEIPEDLKR